MAKQGLKVTPFFRLILFLLLFAPIAYMGAAYFNGEDGLSNIKEMLGVDSNSKQENPNKTIDFQAEIKNYKVKIQDLEESLEKRNEQVEKLEKELKAFREKAQ